MKKIASVFIGCIIVMSVFGSTVLAAYEAPTDFSYVFDYQGRIYTTEYFGSEAIVFCCAEDLYSLPDIYYNGNYIYVDSFCFYHDKLYFLGDRTYSDPEPTCLYSCNIDGSGVRLLADNVSSLSNRISIVDDVLYYTALCLPEYGYYGGIYSINLNDLSWKKICNDEYVSITYCDGDYVYYGHLPYFRGGGWYRYREACAIRTDGTSKILVNSESDEIRKFYAAYIDEYEDYYLKGNQCYYISHGILRVREKNNFDLYSSKSISSAPYGHSRIISVTDNYIYCVNEDYPYANLYKFSR